MHRERWLRLIAGVFIMASVALAVLHSKWWLLLTGFVGLNLFQSAFTDWCPMVNILAALGVRGCAQSATAESGQGSDDKRNTHQHDGRW
ncbi:MAG: DUF2892 domain-containing protein [Armatimonadota bacterium]